MIWLALTGAFALGHVSMLVVLRVLWLRVFRDR